VRSSLCTPLPTRAGAVLLALMVGPQCLQAQKMHVVRVEAPFAEAAVRIEALGGLVGFVGEYFELPDGTHQAVIDVGGLGVAFRFALSPDGLRLIDRYTLLEGCARAPAAPRYHWRVQARPDPQYAGVVVINLNEPAPADDQVCISAVANPAPARFASLSPSFASPEGGLARAANPGKVELLVYEILVRSLPKGAPVLIGQRTVGLTEIRLSIPYRLDPQGRPVQNDQIFIRMRGGPSCRLAARQAIEENMEHITCNQRLPGPPRQPQPE
jgi:hypothetical protein